MDTLSIHSKLNCLSCLLTNLCLTAPWTFCSVETNHFRPLANSFRFNLLFLAPPGCQVPSWHSSSWQPTTFGPWPTHFLSPCSQKLVFLGSPWMPSALLAFFIVANNHFWPLAISLRFPLLSKNLCFLAPPGFPVPSWHFSLLWQPTTFGPWPTLFLSPYFTKNLCFLTPLGCQVPSWHFSLCLWQTTTFGPWPTHLVSPCFPKDCVSWLPLGAKCPPGTLLHSNQPLLAPGQLITFHLAFQKLVFLGFFWVPCAFLALFLWLFGLLPIFSAAWNPQNQFMGMCYLQKDFNFDCYLLLFLFLATFGKFLFQWEHSLLLMPPGSSMPLAPQCLWLVKPPGFSNSLAPQTSWLLRHPGA